MMLFSMTWVDRVFVKEIYVHTSFAKYMNVGWDMDNICSPKQNFVGAFETEGSRL